MIAIVDYGVGNLFSLYSSFKKVGADIVVTSDKKIIQNAEKVILPGVGAYADAAKKLVETGMDEVIREEVKKGKYVMGICLGMQLLFDKSFEYGIHEGLGMIHGDVIPMKGFIPNTLKVPHIGWNKLLIEKPHFLFKYCNDREYVYFVHSYFATNCQDNIIATMEYGEKLTASVAKDNVLGCQFHPEKSGESGLNILRAFCEE